MLNSETTYLAIPLVALPYFGDIVLYILCDVQLYKYYEISLLNGSIGDTKVCQEAMRSQVLY